ncbi:MAG: hypothetical protein FWF97_01385 [Alphaproteobacteria bacterium]|nr:hypothetical protein [Alphaproteobacteria bacterium]
MKNKIFILYSLFFILFVCAPAARAADTGTLCPRIFTTSSDWESITGLRFAQYDIEFVRDRTIGNIGWEIYMLDGFPCFGQAEDVRQWISPSNISATDSNARMRITCIQQPTELLFAWREASRHSFQARTTGILICNPTGKGRRITVKLQDCVQGKNWNE